MKTRIGDISLGFDDEGRGMPILWVHGYPLDRTFWRPQVASLDGFRHIVPDLRGFGESDAPPGAYTMAVFADDLRRLLDDRGVERAVFAGLSMGGYIAFTFARRFGDRLAGLVLADTRPVGDTPEAARGRREQAERVLVEGVAPVVEPMMEKLVCDATRAEQPQLVERLRAMLLSNRPEGVAGALRGLAERPDATPWLADITVPTLVIVGEDDVITPPAESWKIHQAVAGSRLVEIPRAGHVPNWEQPEAFNAAVREFVIDRIH